MRIVVLPEAEWTARQARHEAGVGELLAGRHERAGRRHPVEDFLFSYYSFRPARLRRWHPGFGTAIAGPGADRHLLERDHVRRADGSVMLDPDAFMARRGEAVRHVAGLLAATAGRPAQLRCFGLHEWAMVYRQEPDRVRHASWPLRLGAAGTDAVVEQHQIRCTHHDAFRFFTPSARPLNVLQPTRAGQVATEQPGCLHATMDLYKWAYKLSPGLPAELTLDAFRLAAKTRELDMRASPYDLSALGYEPIPIETADGKADYVARQRQIGEAGQALRGRMLAAVQPLIEFAGDDLLR